MGLNLYRISQTKNNEYDTFDSAVVVAESAAEAKKIHPARGVTWYFENNTWVFDGEGEEGESLAACSWCLPMDVKVEFLGIPDERFKAGAVICASFNAG